ncbi:MAG: alanine racemase, partial [Candidatus Omnitrophica bacterium CG1_02_46_14]
MNFFPFVWAEVDLLALKRNLKIIRSEISDRNTKILCVVKANAYGHGMEEIAKALKKEGVDFFGVATIDEALQLRRCCPKVNILVLGSFHKSQVPKYIESHIIPTISSLEDLDHFEKALRNSSPRFPVHIKIDTGMGRLGVWHEEVEKFFKEAVRRKKIIIGGIYTHFANADHADKNRTDHQMVLFDAALQKMKKLGINPRFIHAANSMGVVRFRYAHLNLVRPGIILYGMNPLINPLRNRRMLKKFTPILSLKTRISFLKSVEPGRTISYGSTYKVSKKTILATLPIGYSHGYRVGFSNKAFVIVKGKLCPVVGRVTMDQTLVDVGRVPGVKRWDKVTLIGKDQNAEIQASDLAALIGTVSYEISCALHSRIPRIYKGF